MRKKKKLVEIFQTHNTLEKSESKTKLKSWPLRYYHAQKHASNEQSSPAEFQRRDFVLNSIAQVE